MVMERPTIAGDHRYDLAKLAHSIDGAYDFIIAGLWTARFTGTYDLSFSTPETQQRLMVQELFQSMRFDGHRPNTSEIRAIVLLLFLSMLPLHADNLARQNALLANVFRLYLNLEA